VQATAPCPPGEQGGAGPAAVRIVVSDSPEEDVDDSGPNGAVVVITGTSSGIGRATARRFAQEGARVVLAARRAALLEQVAQECLAAGGSALVVPTDVGQHEQVEALTERAVAAFGRIDVWVNSAAVLALGRVEETPMADHEQVIRTNLFGYLHGTCAAIIRFRQQGHGVLINNASVLGAVAAPFASSYCATKWGIRGLTESVRMELLDEPNIHVCTVLPAAIDTPIFRHAANYTGHTARAPEPVYSAERVAATIVALAKRPRREVAVGGFAPLGMLGRTLAPAVTERLTAAFIARRQFRKETASQSHGNLFEPAADDGDVSGDYRPLVWDRLERPLTLAALITPILLYAWRRRHRWLARAPSKIREACKAGPPFHPPHRGRGARIHG
jgi:short-subunit dehydrogenase